VRHQNAVSQGVLMRVFDDSLCGVRQITSHGICVCRICVHEISTLPKARLGFAPIFCPLDGGNRGEQIAALHSCGNTSADLDKCVDALASALDEGPLALGFEAPASSELKSLKLRIGRGENHSRMDVASKGQATDRGAGQAFR
jgi:hypothetical protein